MKDLPPFSTLSKSIVKGGTYQHYSGKQYNVLAIARHSETLQELVVYQGLYGDKDVWVRPLEMFLEQVIINEKSVPRFRLLG